jgi:hypothetical protein
MQEVLELLPQLPLGEIAALEPPHRLLLEAVLVVSEEAEGASELRPIQVHLEHRLQHRAGDSLEHQHLLEESLEVLQVDLEHRLIPEVDSEHPAIPGVRLAPPVLEVDLERRAQVEDSGHLATREEDLEHPVPVPLVDLDRPVPTQEMFSEHLLPQPLERPLLLLLEPHLRGVCLELLRLLLHLLEGLVQVRLQLQPGDYLEHPLLPLGDCSAHPLRPQGDCLGHPLQPLGDCLEHRFQPPVEESLEHLNSNINNKAVVPLWPHIKLRLVKTVQLPLIFSQSQPWRSTRTRLLKN